MSLNGIIISTQTPQKTGSFPRPGGTAYGLNQVTGLPYIKMHRNGKARENESLKLNKIDNDSVIFITGHGGDQAGSLAGNYVTSSFSSMDFEWGIDKYVNLLMDNVDIEKLKRQANKDLEESDTPARPHLNIVLWVCQGARDDSESTAAKIANLFAEKGIDVSILANQDNTNRFDGKFYAGNMLFHNNNDKVRVFHCYNGELTIEKVASSELLYVHKDGISGFYSSTSKPTEPSFDLAELVKQSKRKDLEFFEDSLDVGESLTASFPIVCITISSAQKLNPDPESYLFSVHYKSIDGNTVSYRYKLKSDGKIYDVSSDFIENGTVYDNLDDAIEALHNKYKPWHVMDDVEKEQVSPAVDNKDDSPEITSSLLMSLFNSNIAKGTAMLATDMLLGAAADLVVFTALSPFVTPSVAAGVGASVGVLVAASTAVSLGLFAYNSTKEEAEPAPFSPEMKG